MTRIERRFETFETIIATMAVPSTADFRRCLFIHIILVTLFCLSTCFERELSYELNPNCPVSRCNNNSVVEIVHVSAVGPNDTLHHVWCFHPKPAVLIARTSFEAKLSVTWEEFPKMRSSISFTPQPHYSFGVLVNQIFEYNDEDDNGILNVTNNISSYVHRVEMPDTWVMAKPFELNRDSAVLVMDGSWKRNGSSVKEGTLRVELETFREEGHGSKLPHLLHSSNATQVELSLFNLLTNSSFHQSRFAVELLLAANESTKSYIYNSSFKSLDDERTPGVFTLVNVQTPASKVNGNGGYMQWRPVAYIAEERDIVNSTESAIYYVKNLTSICTDCDGTLLAAYFGANLDTYLLNAFNISFGSKGDGFYAANNASIWTATVGFGNPPDEKFSLTVILIIGICLGVPAVLIALSGLYIALRRISYHRDDLFLSE